MQVKPKNVKLNIQITTDTHILKYGLHEISFTVYILKVIIQKYMCLNLISLGNMEEKTYSKIKI